MFQLKVPFLPQVKIESAANELLRKYGKWKGTEVKPPIDIDDIIEGYFGLQLTFCNLEEILGMDDVLGATWFEDEHIKIASSGSRTRFSSHSKLRGGVDAVRRAAAMNGT